MTINNWDKQQAARASSTWGQTVPPYSREMFDFLILTCKSILDLGCGFGRFPEYWLRNGSEIDYKGYDSSRDMTALLVQKFPMLRLSVFHRDVTDKIIHQTDGILISAVLIHITLDDQQKVLNNVREVGPDAICFDINSPSEQWLKKGQDHFEKIIPPGFRMTWQSHYVMTDKIKEMFPDYDLETSFYPVHKIRRKVVYKMLKK